MAIIKGGIDTEVKGNRIPKYKATIKTIDRGTLFKANDWKIVSRTHYIPGIGNVHCWEGKCCKEYGEPKIRNVYPWLKYPTSKKGNVDFKDVPEMMYLELSNKKDLSIKTKNKVARDKGLDLAKLDILIVGNEEANKIEGDNGKTNEYVDFTFESTAENFPSYAVPEAKQWLPIIQEQWKFYIENIERTLGRVISSDAEYDEIMKRVKEEKQNESKNPFDYKVNNNQNSKALPDKTKTSTISNDVNVDDLFQETKTTSNDVKKEEIVVNSKDDVDLDKFFED